MKGFIQRAAIFAAVNGVLILLLLLISKLPADNCILYGTLCSVALGLPCELYAAKKAEVRPDIAGGWGAAILGSLVMAVFVLLITWL